MTDSSIAAVPTIQLSTGLTTFATDDQGGWERMLAQARILDQAGFDRIAIPDHVVYGERLDEYARPEVGGTPGGKQPTGPDGHWLEPMTTLAVIAGMTTRIRLGTGILLAALRRPVVLAKQASTLDVLSGGRLDLGVGVGWQREEYDAAGLDFTNRGRLLDHTLEVCQTLWGEQRAAYSSPELTFEAIHQMPKPRQAGGVPIWVSGTVNRRVASRLARFGTRWIPWGTDAGRLAEAIPEMLALLAEEGWAPGQAGAADDSGRLQVMGYLRSVRDESRRLDVAATMAQVPGMVAAGITDVRLPLVWPEDDVQALDEFANLVAAFRAATE